MLAFPSLLVDAAKRAGIKTPPDPEAFDKTRFPHFHVFCAVQLGRAMEPGEQFPNAKVIAAVPKTKILEVTLGDLLNRGLRWRQ